MRTKTRWFLFQTQPNRERFAGDQVREAGDKFYLPQFFDDERKRPMILFPSYLFVNTRGMWSHILDVRGISSCVMTGENPSIVPHALIRKLKSLQTRTGMIKLPKRAYHYHFNQKINVKSGPFSDLSGLFQAQDKNRICLLLDLLGSKRPVWFDKTQLSAA